MSQFADPDHHIQHRMHPRLRFEVLQRRPDGARFAQEVRLLGIRQRDVFERRLLPDGSIHDQAVEGFNRGGSLFFGFVAREQHGCPGTEVQIGIRLPLPRWPGALVGRCSCRTRGRPSSPDPARPAARRRCRRTSAAACRHCRAARRAHREAGAAVCVSGGGQPHRSHAGGLRHTRRAGCTTPQGRRR